MFVSHSSDDKESYIEPIVTDLESCFINVWIDKRKILPGDNLRKSIFREGLDKADVALIFFTQNSLKSSWVDREIKHVLREETKKGNQFDLNKIISVFDSQATYAEIAERYPELTDDLLHLMPADYTKVQIGQLISAIWSKYLSLQGGDVETQRQLLEKDKELFQKTKELADLERALNELKAHSPLVAQEKEFADIWESGRLKNFIKHKDDLLGAKDIQQDLVADVPAAVAFGMVTLLGSRYLSLSDKGRDFFKWCILNRETTE